MIFTRHFTLGRNWDETDALPHLTNPAQWNPGYLIRGGAQGVTFPGGRPLMETNQGRYIPCAQDPTDPRTWMVPVVWT